MDAARHAAYIAVVVNGLELVSFFPQELKYIWRSRKKFSLLKAFYIYARYFIFILHSQRLANETVNPAVRSRAQVESWLLYHTVCIHLLLWGVNYPYMKMVHSLFGGTRKAAIMLILLAFTKVTLDIYLFWTAHVARRDGEKLDAAFQAPKTVVIIYSCGEALFQLILFCAAIVGRLKAKYMRTPVTVRLVMGGSTTFIIGGQVLTLIISSYMDVIAIDKWFYPFFSMSLSSLACRYILCTLQANSMREKRTTFDYISQESSEDDDDEKDIDYDGHCE